MPEDNFFLQAKTFEELYDLLRKEELVEGSNSETYEAKEVIKVINNFRSALKKTLNGETDKRQIKKTIAESDSLMSKIKKLTRKDGLRIAVAKLAVHENKNP